MGRSAVDDKERKVAAGIYVKQKILDALTKKEVKKIAESAIEHAYEKSLKSKK